MVKDSPWPMELGLLSECAVARRKKQLSMEDLDRSILLAKGCTAADTPSPAAFVQDELHTEPGCFGRFITSALRARIPLRICGSALTAEEGSKEDWRPYEAYMAIFDAYAGYFCERMEAARDAAACA